MVKRLPTPLAASVLTVAGKAGGPGGATPGLASQLLARAQARTPQGGNGSAQGVARRRRLPSSYALRVRRFDAPRLAVPVVIVAPAVEAAGTAHLVELLAGQAALALPRGGRGRDLNPTSPSRYVQKRASLCVYLHIYHRCVLRRPAACAPSVSKL